MSKSSVDRWFADYKRQLDHRVKLDAHRRQGDEHAARRRETHRLEEKVIIAAVRLKSKLPGRTLEDLERFQRIARDGLVMPGTEHDVALWRAHVDELIATHRIAATYDVLGAVNAYAVPGRRMIDISPICNVDNYVTAMHEVGHIAHGCSPSHRRTKTANTDVCVQCELTAWRFAQANARPTWTKEMHACLRRALLTYRQYGTPAEQREIDRMVSNLGFCAVQLDCAKRR
jgi:hypothetical protein